ncbi:MAG: hypothetical protein SNJ29_13395 [Rikenellaceae bacterium]
MLTRDEILNIDAHCRDNGVSRSAYLRELGRSSNEYYNSRRRLFGGDKGKTPAEAYVTQQEQMLVEDSAENSGGFLPIQFTRNTPPATPKRTRSKRKQEQELANGNTLLIEMRTPSGTELRIQGQINIKMLKEIIHASGGGMQDV